MKATTLLLALLCLVVSVNVAAQTSSCTSCTAIITTLDSANYTINEGDTICISAEGVVTGTITLNGGVLCNSGTISPLALNFSSGTIINTGTLTSPTALQLNANSQIINQAEGTLNISGYLSVSHSTASVSNEGSLNIQGNLLAANGAVTNNGVINCVHNSAAQTIVGSGTLNESSPN